MSLDKKIKLARLYEFYSSALSDTQRDIAESSYILDESLGEIASRRKISRQAVSDSLTRTEVQLMKMEENFHILKKYDSMIKLLDVKNLDENIKKEICKIWEE